MTASISSIRYHADQSHRGLEWSDATFRDAGYSPHRHDTYTLALTLFGVQQFRYRGTLLRSLPRQLVILHPDELHDGEQGDERGFAYRCLSVPPSLVADILDGALPFLPSGVTDDRQLIAPVLRLLSAIDRIVSDDELDEALVHFFSRLDVVTRKRVPARTADAETVRRAIEFIESRLWKGFSLDELGHASMTNRWQLCRDFRLLVGTSPHRYLVMRRLDRARRMMRSGAAISDTAIACGFADQSHLNRHFKNTYGLTPKGWLRSIAQRPPRCTIVL